MNRRPLVSPDLVVGLALIAVGVGVVSAISGLPAGTVSDPLGPRGFPTLLAFVVILLGLVLVALAVLSAIGLVPGAALKPDWQGDADSQGALSVGRLIGGIVASAAYVVLLQPAGYLISTAAYLAVLVALQGGVPRLPFIATVFGFPLSLFILFALVLGVPMPAGFVEGLIFREAP